MKEERAKRKAVEREQARQRAVADASAKRSHAKEVRVSAAFCVTGICDGCECDHRKRTQSFASMSLSARRNGIKLSLR